MSLPHNLMLGDCIDGMQALPAENFDLVFADPPFGIGFDGPQSVYNRDESMVNLGYSEVEQGMYENFTMMWIYSAVRLLRKGGAMYVVSGWTMLHHILNILHRSGMKEINHLIWKYNFGVWTTRKYVASHYHILYWRKPGADYTFNTEARFGLGERTAGGNLNYRDREDVWLINREYKPGQRKNANTLPLKLVLKCLQYSTKPGDKVLDPFLGGFTTVKACNELGLHCTGFEINPVAYQAGIDDNS